jgi:aspartate/methionine/tyrosine aminotransferase
MRGSPFAINPLVAGVGAPPIPEARGWIERYDGRFGPAIDLSQAVPGHPPHPDLLRRMAEMAGSAAGARYGAIEGDDDLRGAYAADVARLYGARIEAADVAITAGCNLAFVVAMMLIARAGDAVLLPTPWYFNHQMSLDMLGIEPRSLPCRAVNGFVPQVEDAEALLDPQVRAIVLVTPNNPTGAVYPPEVIGRFADLCSEKGIHLVLDETYRDFLPPDVSIPHIVLKGDRWRDSVIQLYSFSKAYAIPGHRCGAILADARLTRQVEKILDCLQICPPRTAQPALAEGIEGLRPWREENRAEINRRIDAFRAAIAQLPGWSIDSIGAYFAYLRHPFPGEPSRRVAERLAAERGVLCLPGSFFGPDQDGHLRVAFANVGTEVIAQLPERILGWGSTTVGDAFGTG